MILKNFAKSQDGMGFASLLIEWGLTPEQFRNLDITDKHFIVESHNARNERTTY